MTLMFIGLLQVVKVHPYLTLPSGWAGCYTCSALRPYQFGQCATPV